MPNSELLRHSATFLSARSSLALGVTKLRAQRLLAQLSVAALIGIGGSIIVRQFEGGAKGHAKGGGHMGFREGGDAKTPTEIPPGGWAAIIRRTYDEVGKDRVLAVAAGVTFYGLLALFPAITAFVSLYGIIADRATVAGQLAMAEGLLPAGALEVLRDQITRIATGNDAKLGVAFLISLGLSAWSANAGVKALFDALNVAYGEDEKRNFLRLNLTTLGFTLAILLFAMLALGAIAVVPVLLNFLYLGPAAEWLLWLGRWPALIVVLMLGLSALYRFGPSRDNAQWKWVSPGAILASVTWLVGSLAFSWYVATFEDYNKTYGTLGAVIALLMWMWLSATIVLIGAELNSEAERQTLRDTTKGPPEPIGFRGADAADHKG